MACIVKRRGRYVIDCYDQHGKRYRKTLKAGTNRDEARKALRETEDRIARRTFMMEKKIPIFSKVAEEWLEYKKTRCRETTWEMYEGHLNNHLTDMDGIKVNLITTATIEKYISARQNQDMNLGTLRKVLVTLNQVMGYAVRHRYIDYNPLRDAERPKATGSIEDKADMRVLSPDQVKALINAETDLKYRTLFLVAVMTGMRQGELLGLKWSDIDFEKKQAHVQRTYNHHRFFTPKTKGSIRRIDLSPVVILELKKWRLAGGRNDHDLIFPNDIGNPMSNQTTLRRFYPALAAAQLPRVRFHDLRHTFASLLIAQGENIKYIQNQLGHASPMVTLNVYAHLMKDSNQDAVCRLESTIFEATGHNSVTNTEMKSTAIG